MGISIFGFRQPLIECSVNDAGATAKNLMLQQKAVTQDRANLNLRRRCLLGGHFATNYHGRDVRFLFDDSRRIVNHLRIDVRHFFLWSLSIVNWWCRGIFGQYPVEHFLHQLETLGPQITRCESFLQDLADHRLAGTFPRQ